MVLNVNYYTLQPLKNGKCLAIQVYSLTVYPEPVFLSGLISIIFSNHTVFHSLEEPNLNLINTFPTVGVEGVSSFCS